MNGKELSPLGGISDGEWAELEFSGRLRRGENLIRVSNEAAEMPAIDRLILEKK